MQPVQTIAEAGNTGAQAILSEWNENKSSPSINELRSAIVKLGFSNDLLELYEAYEDAKIKHKKLMKERAEKGENVSEWQFNFNWQKFLAKGIWKQRFEHYQDWLAKSRLPFLKFEKERIEARKNAFAQRIFNIVPDDARLRLHLDDFRISRSYFFGIPLFPPFLQDGSVCFGFCHMKNDKGNTCGMKNVDCFGHHAFICPCTSKHLEHNAIRNVVNAESKGLGFLAEKEVAMPQFDHRADNLLTDLETGKLPYAIDVTIRACHQQGLQTVARVVSAAVKEKQREFATKDDNGRKKAEVFVVPFVMTSMGNIDQGATKFLNTLKKRDPFKAEKLMNLISVQHAKWIAVRLRKCMGFHSKTMEARTGKVYLQPPKGPQHDRSRQGNKGELARFESVLR